MDTVQALPCHERMLLALLRAALTRAVPDEDLFRAISSAQWAACRRLAVEQGVMALAWEGVQRLPAVLQPPKALKLAWALAVERQEQRYATYVRTAVDLSRFYAERGITTVLLKGVGLSVCYPVPCHREGGDIDIFTCSADPARMEDKAANHRADRLMEELGIDVEYGLSAKHSLFYYRGIPVENHKTFLDVDRYAPAAGMERRLRQCLSPVQVTMEGGAGCLLVPSPAFNTWFLAFHAAQHFARGMVLRHLCDWACLLSQGGGQWPAEAADRCLHEWMQAMTQVCHHCLGTAVCVEGGEALGSLLLEEVLHPRYAMEVPVEGRWAILTYKTRRFLYRWRMSRRVLRASLLHEVALSVRNHVRHPGWIFRREQV